MSAPAAKTPDPADEFMDFLGLPREAKLELWEAALELMPEEFWGKLLEFKLEE